MIHRTILSLTVLAMFLALSAEVSAKEGESGVGIGINEKDGDVVVTLVRRGAKAAGLELGDVLVSVDGKSIRKKKDAMKYLKGKRCSYAKDVVVKRGSEQITFAKVFRVPGRKPGDCVGYYEFKTEAQRKKRREMRELGDALYDSWKKQTNTKLRKINEKYENFSKKSASDRVGKFIDDLQADYFTKKGKELDLLKETVNEVLAHMLETMPEGKNGRWVLDRVLMRITDSKKGGAMLPHTDSLHIAALITLKGRTTVFHHDGCLGEVEKKKKLRSTPPFGTLLIAGTDRFTHWKDKKDKDVPTKVRRIREVCEDKDAEKKWKTRGVPHAQPNNQHERVVLILRLEFLPN